jgi:NitT/TauT family transport system substrate-binding protein
MTVERKTHLGRRPAIRFLGFMLLLACTVAPAVPAFATPLQKASFIPLWSPQAQFAGYYMALEKGFYARHGIDLTILTGGPGHGSTEALLTGKADFAVLWLATALKQHAAEKPIVNLAQVVQRSAMMLVSRKTSGIRTPEDMTGKKIGVWAGDLALPVQAFFTKYQVNAREIPQSYTVNLFLRGGVDVASAMWYNEYHTILNTGINPEELQVFHLYDYGLNFPEDGLYMMEETYENNPELARAFVTASLEGWQYAFEHPDEALAIVIRYMREANVPSNLAHQRWMLARMKDLIMPANGKMPTGKLDKKDFQMVADTLLHEGLIVNMPDYDSFTGERHAEKQ